MLDEDVPSNIDLKERILTAENEIATNLRIANLNFLPIEYFKEAS